MGVEVFNVHCICKSKMISRGSTHFRICQFLQQSMVRTRKQRLSGAVSTTESKESTNSLQSIKKQKTHAIAISNAITFQSLTKDLLEIADPQRAITTKRFFKVGPNSYTGPNDEFIGIRIPVLRQMIKEQLPYFVSLRVVDELFQSNIHEYRFSAVICLVECFEKANTEFAQRLFPNMNVIQYENEKAATQQEILKYYLSKTSCIDNWDLVDCSLKLPGQALMTYHIDTLDTVQQQKQFSTEELTTLLPSWYTKLLMSQDLWELRIAIVCLLSLKKTHAPLVFAILTHVIESLHRGNQQTLYIRNNEFSDHDLIHKAIGWVARECGKHAYNGEPRLIEFLRQNHQLMARISISYACEKLGKRPDFLKLKKKT